MSDHTLPDPEQDGTSLPTDLARLHDVLLREGERWRQDEPSTARLERHVQTLARFGAAEHTNGHGYMEHRHGREDMMLAERNPVTGLPAQRDAPTPHGAHSRWRALLPAVAAVLLVALAGSIFALFGRGHIGPGRVATHTATATPAITHVTAVRPAHLQLPMPANTYLSAISFSSAHDGWAVGGIRVPDLANQDYSVTHTVLIHYHDGVWTASSETIPNASLSSVSMVSADDGWAVGMTNNDPTVNTGGTAFLLHYTGGHWQRVDAPALAHTYPDTIHMLSPDFGYITGEVNVTVPDTNTVDARLLLLVYQRGTWTSIPNTFEAYGIGAAMVSSSEGWVTTGSIGDTSAFYHYLNGVWTKTTSYHGLVSLMREVAPHDIWAAGINCVGQGQCEPVVYRYDGATWSPVSAPDAHGFDWINNGATTFIGNAADELWFSLASIDPSQGPNQWHYHEYLYAYAHGAWARQSLPLTDGEIIALSTDGNGGTWAIVQKDAPFAMYVLYTSGSTWLVYGRG